MASRGEPFGRADEALFRVIQAECKRRGMAERRVFADWPLIVGRELSEFTAPLRISYSPERKDGARAAASLHVALFRPARAMEVQMQTPQLLEALAVYLGHRAVEKIVLRHLYPPKKDVPPVRERRPFNADGRDLALKRIGEDVTGHERLRAALEKFARTFYGAE
jgi:hypothetical protein